MNNDEIINKEFLSNAYLTSKFPICKNKIDCYSYSNFLIFFNHIYIFIVSLFSFLIVCYLKLRSYEFYIQFYFFFFFFFNNKI